MTGRERSRRYPPTASAEAVGESGGREVRRQTDDAAVRPSSRVEDDADAGGHRAKRQRPGIGREEQNRPDDARQADSEDG